MHIVFYCSVKRVVSLFLVKYIVTIVPKVRHNLDLTIGWIMFLIVYCHPCMFLQD